MFLKSAVTYFIAFEEHIMLDKADNCLKKSVAKPLADGVAQFSIPRIVVQFYHWF